MPRTTPCIRATVAVNINGTLQQREKRFAIGTPAATIAAWKAAAKAGLTDSQPAPVNGRRTLATDALQYLASVTTMASYQGRRADLEAWLPRFGQRDRRSISHVELELQLTEWQAAGYAPSTLNHRRHALAAVYEFFDPDLPAPVNRTTWAKPAALEARALPWPDVLDLVAALPDSGPGAVLTVMAFTGFPQARIGRLTPRQVQDDPPRVFLEGRRKGKGTASKSLPISQDGLAALQAHFRHYPQGGCCTKTAWQQTFHKAISRVNATRAKKHQEPIAVTARPYDLRHSFGTILYARTGDINAVAAALDVTLETAQRYTLGAVDGQVLKAIAVMDADRDTRLAASRSPRLVTIHEGTV